MKMQNIAISQPGEGRKERKEQNQDYCVSVGNIAVVLDGCGSASQSEIGAKMFGEAIRKNSLKLNPQNFEKFINDCMFKCYKSRTEKDFINKFQFTILLCFEESDRFIVFSSGDGYIITINNSNKLELIEIINQLEENAPEYWSYNMMDNQKRNIDIFPFKKLIFSKKEYSNVYVSSDGIRFIVNGEKLLFDEFCELLNEKNSEKLSDFFKESEETLKDDTSIAM